jgi:hypothetical protein
MRSIMTAYPRGRREGAYASDESSSDSFFDCVDSATLTSSSQDVLFDKVKDLELVCTDKELFEEAVQIKDQLFRDPAKADFSNHRTKEEATALGDSGAAILEDALSAFVATAAAKDDGADGYSSGWGTFEMAELAASSAPAAPPSA